MASKTVKQLPQDIRKAEHVLSGFVEYVEKQQARRYPSSKPVQVPVSATSSTTANSVTTGDEQHEELNFLDSLDCDEAEPQSPSKRLLLADVNDEESENKLLEMVGSRLQEGHGETILEIGVETNGRSMHLTRVEWETALARVTGVVKKIRADCDVLSVNKGDGSATGKLTNKAKIDEDYSGKILIRRHPATIEQVIETRIAVVGNVDAGKSSLLGVLVKGELDDGRGKARVNLFRHKHEIETGRTSSVGMEIMGFDTKGKVVMSEVPGRKFSWEEIGKRSAKVITFSDLAGHEKYLRTTLFGLLSSSPNYCLLMVAANNGLIGMSKEHLGIAVALNVPIMVIVTKIDSCPPNILEQTLKQITKILKSPGAHKIPIFIQNREECVNTATQFASRVCPIFQVSNVTGENLDLVRTFLNILPHHGRYDPDASFEFHVNDIFSVPFVGTVVSGIVKSGTIHVGDHVYIGPDSTGQFYTTSIRSVERKRIGVPVVSAGQSASFALKKIRRKDVRKGMVVLPKIEGQQPPKVSKSFVAEVLILSYATTIKPKYQTMLHVGPVAQTCSIVDIDRPFLRTGDKAMVAFEFVQRPEYLKPGDRLLFREGRTKGLGIVESVGYDSVTKPLRRYNVDAEHLETDGEGMS